jgi:hypothetical protein
VGSWGFHRRIRDYQEVYLKSILRKIAPWTAHFTYDGKEHPMFFESLNLTEAGIVGNGWDYCGEFTIAG